MMGALSDSLQGNETRAYHVLVRSPPQCTRFQHKNTTFSFGSGGVSAQQYGDGERGGGGVVQSDSGGAIAFSIPAVLFFGGEPLLEEWQRTRVHRMNRSLKVKGLCQAPAEPTEVEHV